MSHYVENVRVNDQLCPQISGSETNTQLTTESIVLYPDLNLSGAITLNSGYTYSYSGSVIQYNYPPFSSLFITLPIIYYDLTPIINILGSISNLVSINSITLSYRVGGLTNNYDSPHLCYLSDYTYATSTYQTDGNLGLLYDQINLDVDPFSSYELLNSTNFPINMPYDSTVDLNSQYPGVANSNLLNRLASGNSSWVLSVGATNPITNPKACRLDFENYLLAGGGTQRGFALTVNYSYYNIITTGVASDIPSIPGLRPLITWDFIENPAFSSQASYEIKIGSSTSEWGNSLFSGDILDDTFQSSANSYQYSDFNLVRGIEYYGQIRVVDVDGGPTDWLTFAFIINQLPTVTDYYLTPENPTLDDDLDVNYSYIDLDSHEESGTKIRWYRNGLPQESYDDLYTLPSSALSYGDSWTARIIPSDGLEYGAVVETAAVTIALSASQIDTVNVIPYNANVDDILSIEYTMTNDEYYEESENIEVDWYVNNVLVVEDSLYIRYDLSPGDLVYATLKILSNGIVVDSKDSEEIVILDSDWNIFNLTVDTLKNPQNLTDLMPVIAWEVYKTTAENTRPVFNRIIISKTKSIDQAIYDTNYLTYSQDSFIVPEGVLSRGQKYFIHVGVGDSQDFTDEDYIYSNIRLAGSSWEANVDNSSGWTIEFKLEFGNSEDPQSSGIYIHDGTYFCSLTFYLTRGAPGDTPESRITFVSSEVANYTFSSTGPGFANISTVRISGRDNDVKVFVNNTIVIDVVGGFSNTSNLKFIEYGDIDHASLSNNEVYFKFFRYSTSGAYGFGDDLPGENQFYFSKVGNLVNGSIDYIHDNIIAWLPDNSEDSSQLFVLNENSEITRLLTVNSNYSPITSIYVDGNRTKYIGTSGGVSVIYGEKHDYDFEFITVSSSNILEYFDRITTGSASQIPLIEAANRDGWFSIDTTYRTVGYQSGTPIETGDEYDPYAYTITSSVLHYYTQRTHGHSWFDNVDNKKGWSISLSLALEILEADKFEEESNIRAREPEEADGSKSVEHPGFGIYINDGTYQEILYFYNDRIKLFYSNTFVLIDTIRSSDYIITGKDNNIFIYHKSSSSNGGYSLLANGSGLFTTPAVKTGNSRKPKMVADSNGYYHAVWHDDSSRRSQIFYSSYNGTLWSNPESVIESSNFDVRNPDIDIDSNGRVWVVFEDTSWGKTELAVVMKDASGWNPKVRITNFDSIKQNPSIAVDLLDNVHVVWSDNRNGNYNILWTHWSTSTQSWQSSAFFDIDHIIVQSVSEFEYSPISYINPVLDVMNDELWIVYQVLSLSDDTSSIHAGYKDRNENWHTTGFSNINSSGEFIGFGSSIEVSGTGRNCVKPTISSNANRSLVVIAWEDITNSISQIWGASISDYDLYVDPTQITQRLYSCHNPSAGFSSYECLITFESEGLLYSSLYNANSHTFSGSYSGSDTSFDIQYKSIYNPCISKHNYDDDIKIIYDFNIESDEYLSVVEDQELPQFQLIGDIDITHNMIGTDELSFVSEITQNTTSVVSQVDTTEFALGDFSENSGMLVHWKDLKFYYGYDAKPFSIVKYNTSTVSKWPDNRINDVYSDVFGNIIAATFGGLIYYNINVKDDNPNKLTLINEFVNSNTTSIKWGTNAIWYIGTTSGLKFTRNAGETWASVTLPASSSVINCISTNKSGYAIVGTDDGIFVVNPLDPTNPIHISVANIGKVKCIAVDDNNIIWAGSNNGLFRIENYSSVLEFNTTNGMRSAHVNDIAIVDKYFRFVATAAGLEKMNGMKFSSTNVRNSSLLNDNISKLYWYEPTKSLWVGNLYRLYEIVFRDSTYEIINNEYSYYDTSNISTEELYDKNIFYILDSSSPIIPQTASVFINKNKIDFGYVINESGDSIEFLTDLLVDDQVEIEIANRFEKLHNFNQSAIEESMLGHKRRRITKMSSTSKDQLLVLSDLDKPAILLYKENSFSLPYTTILLDIDAPVGCLQKIETISRSQIRFKIIAYDLDSGLDGYILSNYANFTTDGSTPQDFENIDSITGQTTVDFDIGDAIYNVFDSLTFDSEATIDSVEYDLGTGSKITSWVDPETEIEYLYAAMSSPAVVVRYDPNTSEWTYVAILDSLHTDRIINNIITFNNSIYVTTGLSSGVGVIYRSNDGFNFYSIGSVVSDNARGIVQSSDGTIYIGSDDGTIYLYRNNAMSVKYENIGQSIHSLDIVLNMMVVSTGNKGRIYSFNLDTDDNLIVFDGSETQIENIHIKSDNVTSIDQADVYVSSSQSSTIYKANLGTFEFSKSYQSFDKNITRIKSVNADTIGDGDGSVVVAAIGDSLFRKNTYGWEFLYRHSEEINDFEEYFSGVTGLWLISDSKVTKWTKELVSKTVYLKLKDKAGNYSTPPGLTGSSCPASDAAEDALCCDYSYSISIPDLKNFVNESRIVDISEYGEILFTYDSPNGRSFYSANKIDEEIGVYISEIFNGSTELVSWKSISWVSTEPSDTYVDIYIRSDVSESAIEDAEWTDILVLNDTGIVNIEHITSQYIQFKAVLRSRTRDVSPTLSSVTLRSLTAQSSHFYTTNFAMPSKPVKGLLTSNTFIPISADIVFGINTNDSTDFADYQIIESNRLFTVDQGQFGRNVKIGAKLLSPAISQLVPTDDAGDPYDSSSYVCTINFLFTNNDVSSHTYQFRVRFYNDLYRTQLIHTFYSGNDTENWFIDSGVTPFNSSGISLSSGGAENIYFVPGDSVDTNRRWYITIDSYDGSDFEVFESDKSFICSPCNVVHESGLSAYYYKTGLPFLTTIPRFSDYDPDITTVDTNINFSLSSSSWITTGGTNTGWITRFGILWLGEVYIDTAGTYTFILESDDGSRLFVDHDLIIEHDGVHGFTSEQGEVELTVGYHPIRVEYFQGGGAHGIKLSWITPGGSDSVAVPSNKLFHATSSEYCDELSLPKILNFAIMFELENGEHVKVNLN